MSIQILFFRQDQQYLIARAEVRQQIHFGAEDPLQLSDLRRGYAGASGALREIIRDAYPNAIRSCHMGKLLLFDRPAAQAIAHTHEMVLQDKFDGAHVSILCIDKNAERLIPRHTPQIDRDINFSQQFLCRGRTKTESMQKSLERLVAAEAHSNPLFGPAADTMQWRDFFTVARRI